MDGIIYITLEQAQDIHAKTIKYSGGGTYEHFDLGRLDSVLQNIQNDDYYPNFVDKLTHLFYCTCEFHCFADGNKRLAIKELKIHGDLCWNFVIRYNTCDVKEIRCFSVFLSGHEFMFSCT